MTTLGDIGENALIARLAKLVPGGAGLVVGIGDDCAVVRPEGDGGFDWLFTTDPVLEGVHFTTETPGRAVGHKAVGRVLSDVAAMGGIPLHVLVDMVAPAHETVERIEEVYRGMAALAGRYGVSIVGGDTARGTALELHVFGVGRVERGRAVLRSGARAGERMYVTGALGGSGLGRHLAFEPRLAEGQWLAQGGWATAMMDLSDGLAMDLRRLAEASRVGAELWLERVPASAEAARMGDGQSALEHALGDGEDFELLFTVPAERQKAFEAAWCGRFGLVCTEIGVITGQAGRVECVGAGGERRALEAGGYEHFR